MSGFSRTVIIGRARVEPLPLRVSVRKHRFRKQEARRGKTRRQHLLFTAIALGPSLVLAEVAGSRVLSSDAVTPTSIVCFTGPPGRCRRAVIVGSAGP